MAILNKYYTTWTSDDSQMYKLEIIPSHTHTDTTDTHTSGFVNTQLPDDFLLRDMNLELDLGDIPVGLMSSTLKLNFNIGADGTGVSNFSNLRTKLLRGTDSSNYPFSENWVVLNLFSYGNFQCFNTFILSRSDNNGATYTPIFIGCQKFAADNEVELTKLSPVITLSVEVYDITRCIGEMIRPEIWFAYLKSTNDLVDYGSKCSTLVRENKEYHKILVSSHNQTGGSKTVLEDRLTNGLTFKIQTFEQLSIKIANMYKGHMRAILCQEVNWSMGSFFYKMTKFYSQKTWTNPAAELTYQNLTVCYISEINQNGYTSNTHPLIYGNCIGGMLIDKEGFGQFSNFHEVLVSLQENFMQKTTYSYSINNTPQIDILLVTDTAIPQQSLIQTSFQARQSTVYDSIKFKLFNETLNTCKAVVSNILGDSDTTEWSYSLQTTSGDNSKDLKFLFHNLPLLTYRNNLILGQEEGLDYDIYYRNTINIGTLVYLSEDGIVRKVDSQCKTDWNYDYVDFFTNINTSQNLTQQIITEQQQSGLMQNSCAAIVQFMGLATFKLAEFRTRQALLKPETFGGWGTIEYDNLNSIISDWDPSGTLARGTVTKYSLDIYSGMTDITMMINGVPY
jgi:hypothetical protein